MIEGIYLDTEKFDHYNTIDNDRKLEGFSKINILIGSNNSGKSRFLRTFFSYSSIKYKSKGFELGVFNKIIRRFKSELKEFFKRGDIPDADKKRFFEDFNEIEYIEAGINYKDRIRIYFYDIANYRGEVSSLRRDDNQTLLKELTHIGKKYLEEYDNLEQNKSYDFRFKSLYIPTLRGLRNLNGTTNNLFAECTVRDYFSGNDFDGNIKERIYTGLSLYEDTKRLLLGTKEDRDKVKNFENFLKKTFFNNEEINIIPRIGKDVVYFRIGDHEEHPIYELGDGIQAIIILTYPLFFNQGKNLKIFIEEPEHYLHPGFQRIYIETLLGFTEYQYFITTHSNHLLDLTLDKEHISVYTFKKGYSEMNLPSFTVENVESKDSNILECIGVRNSSVFLSNCTIWVEGITDRIYIRKYLEVYQLAQDVIYKEDLHYSFVEYGGNNITHWSFLDDADSEHSNIQVDRLCGKLFLITDKDGVDFSVKQSAKATRQKHLEEKLKERYYCLQSREIENTLSCEVLKSTISALEKNNLKLDFSKEFDSDLKYKDEKLGTYIDSNAIGRLKTYGDESGTIKDKLNFAKKATSFITKEGDLSTDALELTAKLYEFIAAHNKNY